MATPRFSGDELWRRGQELYEQGIRAAVETAENIGRLVSINVEDGTFILSDDSNIQPRMAFRAANPEASILTLRIGYDVVYTFGGLMERTTK